MRRRTFRRKKRLHAVSEAENEPGEEPSPYTSQHLRLATVQPGDYVEWGSLGALDSSVSPIWQLRDRLLKDGDSSEDLDDISTSESDQAVYDEDMLLQMRKQLQEEKKLKDNARTIQKKEKEEWGQTIYQLKSVEGRGQAELIRLLFSLAGEPWEDYRVTEDELEETIAGTPYRSLPVLCRSGKCWGETDAIVRMLARKFLLLGATNDQHLVVEATYQRLRRVQERNTKAISWVLAGEKNKEKMEWAQSQLLHVVLPPAIKEWEAQILNTKGPYIVASGMTLADLAIMDFLDQCSTNLTLGPLLADHPAVSDLLTLVRRNPKVGGYLEDRSDED